MSKRLQVLLEEKELQEIRRAARLERVTVADWVRSAMRAARAAAPASAPDRKLALVRAGARHGFPSAEVDSMLAEIERGYLTEGPS